MGGREASADQLDDAERDADARALASVLRIRILRLCKDAPRTNAEMAATLGVNPATLLHHVRMLADRGFLAAQPVRRGARGSRERPYLATGKSWRTPDVPGVADVLVQAFLEEFALASSDDVYSVRLGVRLNPDELADFRARLTALFEEYASRDEDPDGEPWSIFLALHEDVGRR